MAWEIGGAAYARLVGGEGSRRQVLCVGGLVAELHDQHVTLAVPGLAARGVGASSYETIIEDAEGAQTSVGFVVVAKRRLRSSVPESWRDDYMHFVSGRGRSHRPPLLRAWRRRGAATTRRRRR